MSDLISREALKKAIAEFHQKENDRLHNPFWGSIGLNALNRLIDNAPTVFDCRSCKNNGNERECVDCHDYSNYIHYENRPQGKWIKVEEGYSYHYECNICHERPLKSRYIREEEFSNFCPNCGAKMGGEHND